MLGNQALVERVEAESIAQQALLRRNHSARRGMLKDRQGANKSQNLCGIRRRCSPKQPQHRSRHNLNYWQFGDYLGIGAGAHSKLSFHDKVLRQMRYKQPQAYMDAVAREEPVQEEHAVTHKDIAFEFMMNALRLNEGFDTALFTERTGLPLLTIRRELEEAEKRGLLSRDIQRIAPTQLGQRFLNDLLEIFLGDSK